MTSTEFSISLLLNIGIDISLNCHFLPLHKIVIILCENLHYDCMNTTLFYPEKGKVWKLMAKQHALKLIWVFLALSSYTVVSIGVLRIFSRWKENAHQFS